MANVKSNSDNLVAIAQGLISYLGNIQLTIDCVVGKSTRQAYLSLSQKDREYVNKALVSVSGNKDIMGVLGLTDHVVSSSTPNKEIVSLIRSYCKTMNFPESTALPIFYIESGLNPKAISKTGAIGLGQLTRVAVKDVLPKASPKEIDEVMSKLTEPDVNIPLSIRAMQNSLNYLNRIGRFNYSVNDIAELYMAYNIGARAASQVLKGQYNTKIVKDMVGYQGSLGPPEQYEVNVRKRLNKAAQQLGFTAAA